MQNDIQPIDLSEQLLLNVKMKKKVSEYQLKLKTIHTSKLKSKLSDDNRKKAFWINIYNAYYQILRTNELTKPEIYKKKLINIARNTISLDDIEHGILRRFRYKYLFGFLPKLFVSKFIRDSAVSELDYRIHFALNCGAKSCPPIAFYNTDSIHQQLDLATQSFLEAESDYNESKKIILTTSLFKWFIHDFGGATGIKKIYLHHLGKDIADYKIEYRPYSWEDDLNNFS